MSVDLYLAPASGFREWGDRELEAFFEREPYPEGEQLGRNLYLALALEMVAHNLENDQPGSKFPLVMRIEYDESENIGWYHDEIEALLTEIRAIRTGLMGVPINRATLQYDNDDDVNRRVSDFHEAYPGRALNNLYDLNHYFVDVFERMAQRALETGQGLLLNG